MKNFISILLCATIFFSFYEKTSHVLKGPRNVCNELSYNKEDTLKIKDSIPSNDSLTLKNVYNELLKDSIKFPEIVLKQVILETGWLKSSHCINRHNLFGFKGKNGYMYFDSWQASVLYYKKWQDRHYKSGSYYQFLINIGYAGDGQAYIDYLKKIKIPSYIFE